MQVSEQLSAEASENTSQFRGVPSTPYSRSRRTLHEDLNETPAGGGKVQPSESELMPPFEDDLAPFYDPFADLKRRFPDQVEDLTKKEKSIFKET